MPQMVDGRYQLHEVIGSGGMATVWRGSDTQLNRTVAVKRPHPMPPGDPRHDRLAREARLAASVSHPNLVEVHDAGSDDGGLFLVMEYIDAPSLGEVGASLDRRQVLTAGSQIARALTAVHAANVVHRDVKPANVLLPANGAKLLDFGVALAAEPMSGFEPTVAGVVFGTRGYAAPEVVAGQPATAASDIYALGVMMFELLAGERPTAEGARVVDALALDDRALDDPAGEFLARCMALDPFERPSAATTADTLVQLASTSPSVLPPPVAGDFSSGSYDRTEVMAPPAPKPLPPQPPPPSAAGGDESPLRPRGNGVGWVVLAGVALFAGVGFLVNRAVGDSTLPPTSIPLPAATVTTAVATTTEPPSTTTEPSTTTTVAPEPSPGAQADAALAGLSPDAADEDVAEELAYETLREGLRGNGRNNDVAEKVAKKIGDAVKENRQGKPEEALKKLEDGAEEAADNLDGFARVWALAVLDSAARRMDLGEPDFSIRFDPSNPLNENGDSEADEEDDD